MPHAPGRMQGGILSRMRDCASCVATALWVEFSSVRVVERRGAVRWVDTAEKDRGGGGGWNQCEKDGGRERERASERQRVGNSACEREREIERRLVSHISPVRTIPELWPPSDR